MFMAHLFGYIYIIYTAFFCKTGASSEGQLSGDVDEKSQPCPGEWPHWQSAGLGP